jgi:hypothetical protein
VPHFKSDCTLAASKNDPSLKLPKNGTAVFAAKIPDILEAVPRVLPLLSFRFKVGPTGFVTSKT